MGRREADAFRLVLNNRISPRFSRFPAPGPVSGPTPVGCEPRAEVLLRTDRGSSSRGFLRTLRSRATGVGRSSRVLPIESKRPPDPSGPPGFRVLGRVRAFRIQSSRLAAGRIRLPMPRQGREPRPFSLLPGGLLRRTPGSLPSRIINELQAPLLQIHQRHLVLPASCVRIFRPGRAGTRGGFGPRLFLSPGRSGAPPRRAPFARPGSLVLPRWSILISRGFSAFLSSWAGGRQTWDPWRRSSRV